MNRSVNYMNWCCIINLQRFQCTNKCSMLWYSMHLWILIDFTECSSSTPATKTNIQSQSKQIRSSTRSQFWNVHWRLCWKVYFQIHPITIYWINCSIVNKFSCYNVLNDWIFKSTIREGAHALPRHYWETGREGADHESGRLRWFHQSTARVLHQICLLQVW